MSKITCYNCGNPGHRRGDPACLKTGKSGHLSKIMCYNCGNSGHRRFDHLCPAKDKECTHCHKKGHFQAQCRSKKLGRAAEMKEQEGTNVQHSEETNEKAPEPGPGGLGLLSPGYESGNFYSLGFGSHPILHSSWDSATRSWCLQGNVCQMESSVPAQTHHIWIGPDANG